MFPINYQEPVFRPPSEGKSFLIQVTIGCSNNLCTYCDMYRSKSYSERSFEDIKKELIASRKYFDEVGYMPKRIFLCDGDALGASQSLLVETLKLVNELFPDLDRVGVYATAQNMLDKTEDELRELVSLKLSMAYLGLESGSDKVLHMIVKRNTQADMIEGCKKLKEVGFKISVIAMLGIGGRKLSPLHIVETSKVVSEISPEYFSFLTTIAIPGTPYHTMVERKMIEPLTCKELFYEMKEMIINLKPRSNILFRANHVSNQYPLGGTFPEDQVKITNILESWIDQTPENTYPPIPNSM